MSLSIGTFNLNNLFSRFSYAGTLDALPSHDGEGDRPAPVGTRGGNPGPAIVEEFRLTPPQPGDEPDWIRTFRGQLIRAKDPRATQLVADRILSMDLDVLCVQEVEDQRALTSFNRRHLRGGYPYLVVIDGNDPRYIDVGVLSKLPLGAVTTWQHAIHPTVPNDRVFSRDLLEIEILDSRGNPRLTVFNTHLKSHYVDRWNYQRRRPRTPAELQAEQDRADQLRLRQAQTIARIIGQRQRSVLAGDLNDPPDSPYLAPLSGLVGLIDALTAPTETRPAPNDPGDPSPTSTAWTNRHKPARQPAQYKLFDQLWITPDLAPLQQAAFIHRRTRLGGDGSDHDPAWIVLNI